MECLIEKWIVNDTHSRFSIVIVGNRDSDLRVIVSKINGAIDRVDDP